MYNTLIKEVQEVTQKVEDAIADAQNEMHLNGIEQFGFEYTEIPAEKKLLRIRRLLSVTYKQASIADNMVMREWMRQQEDHKADFLNEDLYIQAGFQSSHRLAFGCHLKYRF